MEIENIRKSIKQLRKAKGLTQKDMAARLFIDERTYSKIERGEQKSMDIRFVMSVAQILEMNPLNLLKIAFNLTGDITQFEEEILPDAHQLNNCVQQFNQTIEDLNALKQDFVQMLEEQRTILATLKTTAL